MKQYHQALKRPGAQRDTIDKASDLIDTIRNAAPRCLLHEYTRV